MLHNTCEPLDKGLDSVGVHACLCLCLCVREMCDTLVCSSHSSVWGLFQTFDQSHSRFPSALPLLTFQTALNKSLSACGTYVFPYWISSRTDSLGKVNLLSLLASHILCWCSKLFFCQQNGLLLNYSLWSAGLQNCLITHSDTLKMKLTV